MQCTERAPGAVGASREHPLHSLRSDLSKADERGPAFRSTLFIVPALSTAGPHRDGDERLVQ